MSLPVFVNRVLNMKKIKYIGFDMDHTLIRYQTQQFEALVYRLVIAKLIEIKRYPKAIKHFQFSFQDAIRGLIIDSKNGNILKLSRYGAIRQSYHGTKAINHDAQKIIYQSTYVDLKDANYMAVDTSFSIAFCVLYGQLIDFKDENPGALPNYAEIAQDVLGCVDETHSDGNLKDIISQDLAQYVLKDKAVVQGLERLARYGKKIFILTNSDYSYSKLLLDYAINPFLTAGQTWHQLFDYVITLANKPRFFYDNIRFLAINPDNGTMTNSRGKIKPGIYQGGSARKFSDDLSLSGDEILYIGDHIYGDILRLKKDCNWRTALVVEELSQEIASQKKAGSLEAAIKLAMTNKITSEQHCLELEMKSREALTENAGFKQKIKQHQQNINAVDAEIKVLLQRQQAFYNQRWGRIFRAGAEESYFAHQVERFACIYMDKLSDLLAYSPNTYFHAYRRTLAHDE